MPLTVCILASAPDADAARTIADELAGANCTCVTDLAAIDSAAAVIVVCSPRAVPTTTFVGAVERAFNRGVRLLPVLIDLPSPPPQLSHFLAGLRCLECTRSELRPASALLRRAVDRLPQTALAAATPAVPDVSAASRAVPFRLSTWSAAARLTALAGTALAAWRLPRDWTALQTVPENAASFAAWAGGLDGVVQIQALVTIAAGIGFLGWLRAALRDLVLRHRERQVRSWWRLWFAYMIAIFHPPLVIRTISRVWAALADRPARSGARLAVVTIWWLAVAISALAPTAAVLSIEQPFASFGALAAEPPDAAVQRRLVLLHFLGNAGYFVAFALTLVIVRRPRIATDEPTAVTMPIGGRRRGLVLTAAADRPLADGLARRLAKYGIDLYARAAGDVEPGSYDVALVLGREGRTLAEGDLALLDRLVEAGEPPLFPLSWCSASPPSALQARLGPLHWHEASLGDVSLRTLAAALARSPRRTGDTPAGAIRLGTSSGPRIGLAHAAVALFVASAALAIVALGRSFADFDSQALLIIAMGVPDAALDDPAVLQRLWLQELGWRAIRLVPAAVMAVGVVWVFYSSRVMPSPDRFENPGQIGSTVRDYPYRAAIALVACLLAAFTTISFTSPASVLPVSTTVTFGATALLFAMAGAARDRLRALVAYWGPAPATPPPMPQVTTATRKWMALLALTVILATVALFAVALSLAFNQAAFTVSNNPGDLAALSAAQELARGTIATEILLVHLPCTALWWWWLSRRDRELRAAGDEGLSRARRAWALVPLVGHADIPAIVGKASHRSLAARVVHVLAVLAAFAWTVSVLWLISLSWARDVAAMARTFMTTTLVFLLFAGASTLLWWLVGIGRSRH